MQKQILNLRFLLRINYLFSKQIHTMTQELINRLSASFYRQMFYLKMIAIEQEFFLKEAKHSGIKNVLYRLKNSNKSAIEQLNGYMPESKETVKRIIDESDEKIRAIANIIEKLSLLDEETVLQVETDLEQIKIKY